MKIHQLPVAESLASVHGRAEGLDAADALQRFAEFGPNTVAAETREPLGLRLAREYFHFFSLILWIAA
ncbi:MAG: hypothetical protein JSS47_01400, partial [Proteobacteria bacterium]|nr:hypothetical protein [Pseudomonadota bacterium]